MLFCTCTTDRLIPSIASWLTGELGMQQTHASVDLIAAVPGPALRLVAGRRVVAGRPPSRAAGLRGEVLRQDRHGPPVEDDLRDGAAAMVVAPAPSGDAGDIDLLQTYASGPHSEVNSIIWPNPEFDNHITVYGPEVKTLARYLTQMIDELRAQPDT